MIDALTAIAVGVVGAGGEFSSAKDLVNRVRMLRAELEAVVRECDAGASPKGHVPVDKDVGSTVDCNLGRSNGNHVRVKAATLDEEQDVHVTRKCDQQESAYATLITARGSEGRGIETMGQQIVNREDFRARHFTKLRPSSSATANTNPPIKSFEIA